MYCFETATLATTLYSCYYFHVLVHKIFFHESQIIESVELPIGILSEETPECGHKHSKHSRAHYSKHFRIHHSRKFSPVPSWSGQTPLTLDSEENILKNTFYQELKLSIYCYRIGRWALSSWVPPTNFYKLIKVLHGWKILSCVLMYLFIINSCVVFFDNG